MNNSYKQLPNILVLIIAFIVYSCTSISMKIASCKDVFSYEFFLFYFISILILGIYAVLWQIALKKTPLTIAFMSKSITVVFAMIIAHFVFDERISLNNLIGASLVVVGIILLPFKK